MGKGRGSRATFTSIVALALGVSCGRTELDDLEPCRPTDTTRPCQDVCGAGTQTCASGGWHACVVPTTTRACSAICGAGTQTCTNREWQACVVPPVTRACSSACGPGNETCVDGQWNPCDAPQPRPPRLHAVIRDFHDTHADFELPLFGDHLDIGIVKTELGADDTPVYGDHVSTETTSGAASFHDWYHDVPGVNESTTLALQLMPAAAQTNAQANAQANEFVYDNPFFFPIDNQLFGNEGRPHNYHFTLEAHTRFMYVGGETFTFAGDDDVWVFINRRLAIDLGGLHVTLTGQVDLDASAGTLDLTKGQTYQLDIFYAERHTISSTFMVRTSIADASSCEP